MRRPAWGCKATEEEEEEEITKMTADLDEAQKEFSDQKKRGLCIIEELKRENRNLKARRKQFRMSTNHNVSEGDSKDFAVEKILDDKLMGNKRQYYVRWEGFVSDDDSYPIQKSIERLLKEFFNAPVQFISGEPPH